MHPSYNLCRIVTGFFWGKKYNSEKFFRFKILTWKKNFWILKQKKVSRCQKVWWNHWKQCYSNISSIRCGLELSRWSMISEHFFIDLVVFITWITILIKNWLVMFWFRRSMIIDFILLDNQITYIISFFDSTFFCSLDGEEHL